MEVLHKTLGTREGQETGGPNFQKLHSAVGQIDKSLTRKQILHLK